MGLFAIGTIGLGIFIVSGLSLVPKPPAISIVLTFSPHVGSFFKIILQLRLFVNKKITYVWTTKEFYYCNIKDFMVKCHFENRTLAYLCAQGVYIVDLCMLASGGKSNF
jgi:hypothetical protein